MLLGGYTGLERLQLCSRAWVWLGPHMPYAWVLRVLKRLGCRGMPCVCCACDRQVESLTKVQSDHAKPSRVLSGIVTGFGGIV